MNSRAKVAPILPHEAHLGCRVAAMSDVGRVRQENQDYMGYFKTDKRQLLVVADGMGGHSGGFEASRITVAALRESFINSQPDQSPESVLHDGVRDANLKVRDVAGNNPQLEGMGSTLVAVLVQDNQAWIAHVGDSRCYLVDSTVVQLMTRDHSRVNRMVDAGLIEADQAADHPMGHILERSIGCAEVVQAEFYPEPVQLKPGDRLMLCSDGFWGLVSDGEMGRIFRQGGLAGCVERGIGTALARGADDNTTIALLERVGEVKVLAAPAQSEGVAATVVPGRMATGRIGVLAAAVGVLAFLFGVALGWGLWGGSQVEKPLLPDDSQIEKASDDEPKADQGSGGEPAAKAVGG